MSSIRKVRVADSLQRYTYELSEPMGKHFSPEFKPQLTPREMLALGVFGGHYFEGEQSEFPNEWFENAKLSNIHDPSLNFFEIDASQSRQEWQQKGWIFEDDPRGWLQWYCRYYMGRRIPGEDERQITRWKNMKRHIAQVKNACEAGDWSCRRRQRQALLHWAYDSRSI